MANTGLEELRVESSDDTWTKLFWSDFLKKIPKLRLLDLRFAGFDATALTFDAMSVKYMTRLCPLVDTFGQRFNVLDYVIKEYRFTKKLFDDIKIFANKANA
jgi:hypothetical protein